MKFLKEIENPKRPYVAEYTVPMHTYALNDKGWCVGYRPSGGEWRIFNQPQKGFSKTYRKFITLTKGPVVDSFKEQYNG